MEVFFIMLKFKNIISFSLISSLILTGTAVFMPTEGYAGTKAEVRAQCKRTKYKNGLWKLRIDSIDRDNVGFSSNGTDAGSAYYLLRFANNGLVRQVYDGYDHYSGSSDIDVYPTVNGEAASYMSVGRAEVSQACQLGVSLVSIHYEGNYPVGGIDFIGVGYNHADGLTPAKMGVIELHNASVSYYDYDSDSWSGYKRAKASMTKLQDR